MDLASLFFSQTKQPQFFSNALNNNAQPQKNIGFRPIKRENQSFINIMAPTQTTDPSFFIKKENTNPFNQSLPQNMERILQLISHRPNPLSLFTEKKVDSTVEQPRETSEKINHFTNVSSPPPIINKSPLNNTNAGGANKSLYVGILTSIYNELQKKEKNLNEERERRKEEEESEESDEQGLKMKTKKIKKMNLSCGHYNREHYAKNLCNNCYHKYGRTKKPWNCTHDKLYAHGLCQNCYINKYNQNKKNKVKVSDSENEDSQIKEEEK